MNVPSRRTVILVVVLAGLIVLGLALVLWVKTHGWKQYEDEDFTVALPPGSGVWEMLCGIPPNRREKLVVPNETSLPSAARISIVSVDMRQWAVKKTPNETLDSEVGNTSATVERGTSHGHPTRTVTFIEDRATEKRFLIVAHERLYIVTAYLSDELTEQDADYLFRSFRPK